MLLPRGVQTPTLDTNHPAAGPELSPTELHLRQQIKVKHLIKSIVGARPPVNLYGLFFPSESAASFTFFSASSHWAAAELMFGLIKDIPAETIQPRQICAFQTKEEAFLQFRNR